MFLKGHRVDLAQNLCTLRSCFLRDTTSRNRCTSVSCVPCSNYEHALGGKLPLRIEEHTIVAPVSGESQEIRLVRPSVEHVLDWYIAKGFEDRDPYWAEVWGSAIAVGNVVLDNPELVSGKRVADLGCGLGLAGISCALAGAAEVTFMDYEPLALQCALLSAIASGLSITTSPCVFCEDNQVDLKKYAEELLASSHSSALDEGARKSDGLVTASVFNWNDGFQGKTYDVVIACDVLYNADAIEPLAALIPDMLAGPSDSAGRIVVADPVKRTPKHRQRFFKRLAEQCPDLVVDFVKHMDVQHATSNGDLQVTSLRKKFAGDTVGMPLQNLK